MSLWAFRFLLFYICILLVQPQNRFAFLYPFQIADICVAACLVLHAASASSEGRPLIRFGPATKAALALMLMSVIAWQMGPLQAYKGWNSDIDLIFKNCLLLILIEATAVTVERVWAVQGAILFATLWWVKAGIRLSGAGATFAGDRLMGPAVSLVENPNGYAYMMTVMIPLYLYFYQQSHIKYLRWGYLAIALTSVFIVLETGSRTGLLALIAVGLFLVPKYMAKQKKALVAGAVAITMIVGSIGAGNIERFKTLPQSVIDFMAGADENADPLEMEQDEQSAWERRMKNKHTWMLIQNYPLGVGIQADNGLVEREFLYAVGQVHNEILYAGKQMGYPGMILYLVFVFMTFFKGRLIERTHKVSWPALSDLGWTFKMQSVVFMVGGFFSPVAWGPFLLGFAACCSALVTNLENKSYNAATMNA